METDYEWRFVSQDITNVVSEGIYSPYIFTKTFTLPKGNYSPTNLSLYISKQMSNNNIDFTTRTISTDSFVKCSSFFIVGHPYPNGAQGVIPSDGTYYFDTTMSTRFRFGSTPPAASTIDYLMGASQIQLYFDAENNIFSWQYLHSPLYANDISTKIQNIGAYNGGGTNPSISNNYLKTSENAGIFFTGMQCKTTKGVNFDFWEGVLGFTLSKICASPKKVFTTQGAQEYFDLIGSFYSYDLVVGQNITTGYSGIDNSIIKSGNSWYQLASIAVPEDNESNQIVQQAPIYSTIQDTVPLIADIPYLELLDNFSHYLIDANLGFSGTYIGENKFGNIKGTVSKYYQYDNYCTGGEEGTINYVHRGLPVILKSVKCRILKSNKQPDENLGPDNTLLFEIIKASKPKI
jgi:hypothetical protein